jgi:hypothetical protein
MYIVDITYICCGHWNFYTTFSIPYNEMARGHTRKNAYQRMQRQRIATLKQSIYERYL